MKKLLLTGGLIALALGVYAQTNPVPQVVPATGSLIQDFSTFDGTSTSYPDGIRGTRVASTLPSAVGRLVDTHVDRTISGGTAASNSTGMYDFNGKIGWLSSASADNGVIWALNTINVPTSKRVELKFDAMVMRNLYDGTTNDHKWGLVVMYRIGTTGTYTLIDNDFINNADAAINTSGTVGVNPKSLTYVLPEECSGVAVLHIRWVYRIYSGTTTTAGGDKATFAIDNLTATSVDPLPIKLSSFTGKSALDGIQLNWTTSSERNNKHFELLRSTNGKVFSKIGEVEGNGNSDITLNYTFLDRNAVAGSNYYKIRQVDHDGQSEEFDPIVIAFNVQSKDISVHADKASGQITVNVYANQNSKATINVFDANGRVVGTRSSTLEAGNNKLSINSQSATSDISDIYIISLTTDGKTLTKKFIFQ